MKKLTPLLILTTTVFTSCDVKHHAQWNVRNTPKNSERGRKIVRLLDEEASSVGLIKKENPLSNAVSSYYDTADSHPLPVLEAHAQNNEIIVSLDTGFDDTINNQKSFREVKRSIDEKLRREIKTDFYLQHIK